MAEDADYNAGIPDQAEVLHIISSRTAFRSTGSTSWGKQGADPRFHPRCAGVTGFRHRQADFDLLLNSRSLREDLTLGLSHLCIAKLVLVQFHRGQRAASSVGTPATFFESAAGAPVIRDRRASGPGPKLSSRFQTRRGSNPAAQAESLGEFRFCNVEVRIHLAPTRPFRPTPRGCLPKVRARSSVMDRPQRPAETPRYRGISSATQFRMR